MDAGSRLVHLAGIANGTPHAPFLFQARQFVTCRELQLKGRCSSLLRYSIHSILCTTWNISTFPPASLSPDECLRIRHISIYTIRSHFTWAARWLGVKIVSLSLIRIRYLVTCRLGMHHIPGHCGCGEVTQVLWPLYLLLVFLLRSYLLCCSVVGIPIEYTSHSLVRSFINLAIVRVFYM